MQKLGLIILTIVLTGVGISLPADTVGKVKKLPIYLRLPRPYFCHKMVAVKDCVYTIGGHGSGKRLPDVYYTKTSDDGKLGAWSKGPSLPPGKAGFLYHTVTAGKDCIYVIGGNYKDQAGQSGISSEVWYTNIKKDGCPGQWKQTESLPEARKRGAAIVLNNCLYYLGGQYNREVFCAKIKTDGSLDKWEEASKLPMNLYETKVFSADGFLYIIGGNVMITRQSEKVFRAKILADGKLGKWRRTESLPTPLGEYALVVKDRDIFVFGGTNKQGNILKSTLDNDNHLTEWKIIGEMPDESAESLALVRVGNNIYFGGGIIMGKPNRVLRSMYTIPIIKAANKEVNK